MLLLCNKVFTAKYGLETRKWTSSKDPQRSAKILLHC